MTDEPITSMWSTKTPNLQVAWDATSLQSFMTCPRRYQYESILGWKLGGDRTHVTFGSLFHGALEAWDHARAKGADKATATEAALKFALENSGERLWRNTDTGALIKSPDLYRGRDWYLEHEEVFVPWASEDPKKNRRTLVRAVVWYCDEQPEEGGVTPYVFPDGTVAVELSFRLPLPAETGSGEKYILCGHLDGLAKFGSEVFVRERKTTGTTLGGFYFDNYSPNVQVDTYDLATYIMFPDLKISGVMMEAAQCAVEFNRFMRQPIYHTPKRRDEWLDEIIDALARAEEYALNGHWPMNRAVCGMYGGCPYRSVCRKDPSYRQAQLEKSGRYIQDRWDPLKVR